MKAKKIILYILLFLALAIVAIIYFSPYGKQEGFSYKLMKHTVEVNAPAEKIYKYLGNSANASEWSVFVDHITPLNTDSVADGSVGSRRRCFTTVAETGATWDETITQNIPNKKREIIIYNMKDFPMVANNLATEQLYESLDSNKTKLTFTVFFKDAAPTAWEAFKTYIAAYKIISVFKGNMNNIKRIVESQQ